MTTVLFHAIPLTPIHIGDGTTLAPEDFLIDRNTLLRFSPTHVIADMPAERQQQFIEAVTAGRLKDAQALIRKSVNRGQHISEQIAIGAEAKDYLQQAIANPDRAGEASPFMRMAGRPFIPGSSLKGAFRTALVSDRANANSAAVKENIGPELATLNSPRSGKISDSLQQIALDYDRGATEGDPLRDVAIADATLGPGATRFDKVTVGWTPRRRDEARRGRQLHVERLLSVIDRCPPADVAFTLALAVTDPNRQQRRQRLDGAKTPRAPVHLRPLLEAAHAFHRARWEDEMERLFPEDGSTVRRRLDEAWKKAEGYAQTLTPAAALDGIAPVLLRLGRFTGFESKSVETWRRGWAPQTKKLLTSAGTHSMVVDGADVLPFGWLLLCPASEPVAERTAPPRIGGTPAAATGQRPAPSRPTAPAVPVRSAFLDGEPVEILKKDKDQVLIRTSEGDTDWVPASEIEYR